MEGYVVFMHGYICFEQGQTYSNSMIRRFSIKGGWILRVFDLAGMTQFEDEVEFPVRDAYSFPIPHYIFYHYV
jgi:hypothetical protein